MSDYTSHVGGLAKSEENGVPKPTSRRLATFRSGLTIQSTILAEDSRKSGFKFKSPKTNFRNLPSTAITPATLPGTLMTENSLVR